MTKKKTATKRNQKYYLVIDNNGEELVLTEKQLTEEISRSWVFEEGANANCQANGELYLDPKTGKISERSCADCITFSEAAVYELATPHPLELTPAKMRSYIPNFKELRKKVDAFIEQRRKETEEENIKNRMIEEEKIAAKKVKIDKEERAIRDQIIKKWINERRIGAKKTSLQI